MSDTSVSTLEIWGLRGLNLDDNKHLFREPIAVSMVTFLLWDAEPLSSILSRCSASRLSCFDLVFDCDLDLCLGFLARLLLPEAVGSWPGLQTQSAQMDSVA